MLEVQRRVAARVIQAGWAEHLFHKLQHEAAEVTTMIKVLAHKPLREEPTDSFGLSIESDTVIVEIPHLNSGGGSAVNSRRSSSAYRFVPLKGVKLSQLEALRRERDEAERLRRLQAEELLREKLMRAREELRRRTMATLLMQRVCRAYRRRLFLFAKKLSMGGGRFLISANPFVRSLTTHHMRKQVPYGAHTEITRIISQRSPHLIPELAAAMEAEKQRNTATVQIFVRFAVARVHVAAVRRYFAAVRIQRRWRLVRDRLVASSFQKLQTGHHAL
jgi:hypothetical protein